MKLLGFYFVLALGLSSHATEAVITFTLQGATKATYKQFIANLRTTLTAGNPTFYSIPVLRAAAAGAARFTTVQLTNYDGNSITLGIDVVNVYVVAYRAENTAYFLNDASAEADAVLFNGIPHQRLPYAGNYDGLETAAGKVSRENIELGFSEISSAIGNMFHRGTTNSVPRAFIVLIQSISEAARFKYIEERISENVGTKFKPDPAFLSLQNRWSDLSQQIQIAQNNGGKFARAVELRSISNKPVLVENVDSPIVKGVALLLFYRPRITVDDVIRMPVEAY